MNRFLDTTLDFIKIVTREPEPRKDAKRVRHAARRPTEGPLHRVADAHQPKLSVALRYAFAKGRKVLKANPLKNADKAAEAVADALREVLPAALRRVYVAGGEAGAGLLASRLKAAGDYPGHPFHGNQWTSGESDIKLTKTQHAALEKLTAQPVSALPRDRNGNIKTGINIVTLDSLKKAGVIKVTHLYLGGVVSPDLEIVATRKDASEFRTAKRTTPTKVSFTFDAKHQSAVDWADRHAAELIDGISETTREQINNAIADALEGEGIDHAIDEILDAVGDQDRAETIAHHEVMMAVHEGQREAWDQAVEAGYLTGTEERVWIVTGDEKVCPICEGLEDRRAKLGEPYESDGEEYDGPPAHVRCRCTEGIV